MSIKIIIAKKVRGLMRPQLEIQIEHYWKAKLHGYIILIYNLSQYM
jgi:hypothetical protein